MTGATGDALWADFFAAGNWHCGNPRCRKALDPWAAQGADNAMCLSRRDNYMRGPTHADNNLKLEFCCGMCMTLAQLALSRAPSRPSHSGGPVDAVVARCGQRHAMLDAAYAPLIE